MTDKDSFDAVTKRNNFNVAAQEAIFEEVCDILKLDKEDLINSSKLLIISSFGIIGKTLWEVVNNRIKHIGRTETDEVFEFIKLTALMLAWRKVEQEGFEKIDLRLILN